MKLKTYVNLFAISIIIITIFVCSNLSLSSELLRDELKNITYTVGTNFNKPKKVKLFNGRYSKRDSLEDFIMTWTGNIALGDLNGDGNQDGAVILFSNYGGSGSFAELAAAVNQEGSFENVATVPLGDRVKIESLGIKDGVISVDLLTQGPRDSMANPTQRETVKYRLVGKKLVKQ